MDIFKKTEEVLFEAVGAEAVTGEQDLKLDLGLDSLSLVAVVVGLEEALGVEFDESNLDPQTLVTVADLVRLAEKYV